MGAKKRERKKLAEQIKEQEKIIEQAEEAKKLSKLIEECELEFTKLLQEDKEFADLMEEYGPEYSKTISEQAEEYENRAKISIALTRLAMGKDTVRRWEDITSYTDVFRWLSYKLYKIYNKPESFRYKLLNGTLAVAILFVFIWIYVNLGTWIDRLSGNEPMTEERFEEILNMPENIQLKEAFDKIHEETHEYLRKRDEYTRGETAGVSNIKILNLVEYSASEKNFRNRLMREFLKLTEQQQTEIFKKSNELAQLIGKACGGGHGLLLEGMISCWGYGGDRPG